MTDTETLINKQIALNEQINKAAINHKKSGKARRTEGYFCARLAFLNDLWKQFCDNHSKIQEKPTAETSKYELDNIYENAEELYFESVAELSQGLEECKVKEPKHTPPPTQSQTPAKISLPPIAIPKFDGNYKTWRSFHDLFKTLIHSDTSLSKVQKLHYLKTNVLGEAEKLLRQFEIIESNYDKAWDLLNKRYDNKRALINHHLKTLFNQPQIKSETSTTIKTFLNQTEECLHELQSLQLPIQHWDAILIHILIQKLPPETHYQWEQELRNKTELPTYSEFASFLEARFRMLEAINDTKKTISPKPTYGLLNKSKSSTPTNKTKASNNTKTTCIQCGDNHILYHCPTFRHLNTRQRHEFVLNKHLCKNCLSQNHKTPNCPSSKRCYHCQKTHNSLLHYEQPSTQMATKPSNSLSESTKISTNTEKEGQTIQNFLTSNIKRALLSTALINVSSPSGMTQTLRALIDSGSQVSIMTERAYKRLQLKGSPANHELIGLGTTRTNRAQIQTTVSVESLHTAFKINVNMLIIKKITDLLPTQTICTSNWTHIHGLPLADPTFSTPGNIDILLGADVYAHILTNGVRRGLENTITAQNTKLGWILMGTIPKAKNPTTSILTTHTIVNNTLEDQLKQFWELEECQTHPPLSPEDQLCENFYEKTTIRTPDGRYEVHLPFKNLQPPELGHSRNMAIQQFLQLEKKFSKNPELYKLYANCIEEYAQLGHMKHIPSAQIQAERKSGQNINFYYLPHHAVLKDSTTTKLRVVFNASSKTTNGKSLNEQLMIGPTIQPTLWTILLRWRLHKYAFGADIEKMYRMIQMTPNHQNYQRIIWRNNPNEELQDYALTTVTFGTASAPYLAIRTLQQVAKDEANKYPLAFKSITRDFYVDDLVTGTHDIDEALHLQQQLIKALQSGGFNLRKWTTNHPKLLKNIPPEHHELKPNVEFSETNSIKTLGVQWYPTSDHFAFKVKEFESSDTYTKRLIVSEIATLFDPLGWLAPCIITAKILIQKLWLSKCEWDETVPDEITREWTAFKGQLKALQELRIPRWLGYEPNLSHLELHGFCDASNNAYAAVLYLKTHTISKPKVLLITAKTKVAPIKPITLPRLELCGAVLLSRLMKQVITDLNLNGVKIYTWSDSNITLAWIRKHPSTWKTFVGNRVAEIHENIPRTTWRYVPSKYNPADTASRGVFPIELTTLHTWWNGPEWLYKTEEFWPQQPTEFQTQLENKGAKTLTTTAEEQILLLYKYSSFLKTIRITAYCLRFINSIQKKRPITKWLSVPEIRNAEKCLIKALQRVIYPTEIKCLQKGVLLPKKSHLLSLHPFLDSEGILRVGGRLSESHLNYNQRHPIILPNKHHITNILIDHIHQYTLHGGTQVILSTLRNNYWLINARNTIRYRIHKCITCFRFNTKPATQLMSSLPSARVNTSLPFLHTGVDYAGPIDMKASSLRSAKITKAYICLFVCLATKAIHLELVSDLTTSAFLAALKRFVGRRGLCAHIYSDRGTNFIGANRILQTNLECIENELSSEMANQGITWHFNPPAAPHFGGLWESGVKSTKRHLYKTIKNSTLTYEELNTVLIQIEACLNTRPLSPLSNDPADYNVLTPGHFLTGRHNLTIPEPSPLDPIQHPLKRWQYTQWLTSTFWKKWSNDYLHTLHQRNKWQTEKHNIKTGTLVLIKDNQLPVGHWPLGRIIEVHTGHNNLVRAVTIKTSKGILSRPIVKICPLPLY